MKTLIENVILDGQTVRILIEEDRIRSISGIDAPKPDADVTIDAKGTWVYPGFHDSHCHLLMTGQALADADLSGCRSIPEIQSILKKRQGSVIHGMGWNQELLSEKRMPTCADLDPVSQETPIIIERACTHILTANTKAMELAGKFSETGIFTEDDCLPFMKLLEGQEEELVSLAAGHFLDCGITCVQPADLKPGNWRKMLPVYQTLSDRIRIHHQVNITDPDEMDEFFRISREYETPTHTFGPFKGFADGALGGRTAYLREPYRDDPGNCGQASMSPEEMKAMIRKANELGKPAIFHAIGDAAICQVLDCFEEAGDGTQGNGIIHVQITDADMISRIRSMNLHSYVQPVFKKADLPILESRVGPELAATSYAFDELDSVSLGTDSPIEDCDPMQNLRWAVTPPHAMELSEALRAYTEGSAASAGLAGSLGRAEPGYLADLVFLDSPVKTGSSPRVINTMVAGRLRHPFQV